VSLQTELAAFFTEHGRCGDLDAGVDGPISSGWSATAGARIVRKVTEDEVCAP
jgi:hypothetical protein